MATQKIMTEWGELSIVCRKGYYYATKQVRGQKRQVYLGKTIPSQERLEEVAEEINLPANKWIERHSKELRQKQVDSSNSLFEPIEQLRKIESLASARGEKEIAKLLKAVIQQLTGLQK